MIKTKDYIIFLIVFLFAIILSLNNKVYADNTYSKKYFQNSNKGTGFETGYYYIEEDQNLYEIPNITMTNKYGTVEKKDNDTEQNY